MARLRTCYPVKTQLIKRIAATAQPKEHPYGLRDATLRGLLLRVRPSGHKAWIIDRKNRNGPSRNVQHKA